MSTKPAERRVNLEEFWVATEDKGDKHKARRKVYQTVRFNDPVTMLTYDISVLERAIIYMLISQPKKTDTVHTIYEISISRIESLFGRQIDEQDFRQATRSLLERRLDGRFTDGAFFYTGFIASATYDNMGQGIIEIGLSDAMRQCYLDLRAKLTPFQLRAVLNHRNRLS